MKPIQEWTRKELEDKMQESSARFLEHRTKGDRLSEVEIDLDGRMKQEWKRRERLGINEKK